MSVDAAREAHKPGAHLPTPPRPPTGWPAGEGRKLPPVGSAHGPTPAALATAF